MNILFPNPFGWVLPSRTQVSALQEQYGFSEAYADFLLTQNGFSADKLWDSPKRDHYLSGEWLDSEHCTDLRFLFGIVPDQDHVDLASYLTLPSLFTELWFPIGIGYGGDEFAEILHGKYRGYIASFDHGIAAYCDTLAQFANEIAIPQHVIMDKAALCDLLCEPSRGFAWLHAPSLPALLQQSYHVDKMGRGFLTNEPH